MAVVVPAHSYLLRPYMQAMEPTGSVIYIEGMKLWQLWWLCRPRSTT